MLPAFDAQGNLPPGIHEANWETVVARFGTSPERRTAPRATTGSAGRPRGVRLPTGLARREFRR